MGRRYGRVALGGVHDEAEIRGHRRTYVGARPGRILQTLCRTGTRNPVLVLDEVDKLGSDHRGDPASALLEVLDPEQNNKFVDHFIDIPFDLSQVIFLATANDLSTIPPALLDRMEQIEMSSYTRNEKHHIATDFLVPKQLSEHGLTVEQVDFQDEGIRTIIDHYTREAGVREMERVIASICRHCATTLAEGQPLSERVDRRTIEAVLGPNKFAPELAARKSSPGVSTSLAWTPAGGDIVFVEVSKMPGKGEIQLTGRIRNVVEESATTAIAFVRSKANQLNIDPHWLDTIDIHIHMPRGEKVRNRPCAGLAIFVAVASLLLNSPVRRDVAMVGEITLRGNVLPVERVKEMLIAAHRAGIRTVLIPERNEQDIDEVPKDISDHISIRPIRKMNDALPLALEPPLPEATDPADEDDKEKITPYDLSNVIVLG